MKRQLLIKLLVAVSVCFLVFTAIATSVATGNSETAETEPKALPEETIPAEVLVVEDTADDPTEPSEEVEETEPAYPVYEEIPLDEDTQIYIQELCSLYGVPFNIVLGVIETESTFRANASNGGCYGYMQIHKVNLSWLKKAIGIEDLKDPKQNLRAGIYMLMDLYEKYENWHKALVCYNCGEGGANQKFFRKGVYASTYSKTVINRSEKWAEVVG